MAAASIGARAAWIAPALLVAVSSVPGVVPLSANVLYSLRFGEQLKVAAACTALVGLAQYAVMGARPRVGPRAGDLGDGN
ncbi:hypothetical protein ACQBJO_12715 [Janibacter sp. G349]|uniref:hypothetical protein n=1 Tax=Janibacter sp. G349 TaxID=3405424 RepID=UPI003B765039